MVYTEYQAVVSLKCVEGVTSKEAHGDKLHTHTPLGTFGGSPFILPADSHEQLLPQNPSRTCKQC